MRVPDEYLVDDEALAIRDAFNATGNSLPKELGLRFGMLVSIGGFFMPAAGDTVAET